MQITIDNKSYVAEKGETILNVCKRNNIDVPTLCHDERLEPYSSCFVCVVEIDGMKNLQPSCSTSVRDGMVVQTSNDRIRKARKMALDLLVSNHYADCTAPCKQTCPAGVDVQGYISLIDKGMYSEATALIKEVNPLPAICGRVCVRPCELACRRNLLNEGAAVGIDYLKRFTADADLSSEQHFIPKIASSTGKKVAIIGAGPGGLSTAWFLGRRGHDVDIFEANPHAGGMLRYGIPEYRLPNDLLDAEISTVTELGVNIHYNKKFGENVSYRELQDKYDAVVLTIGSQTGTNIGCEGDDADNVLSGIDFLRNMEMTGQKMDLTGKKAAVVGGGNTAMDCCRTTMRCGAEKVYVIYRRTEKEMPANPIEIHESKVEGIEYLFLTNPKKINKDENGAVKSVTCLKMKLGEPDKSGRRRPIPIEGSDFDIELDYIFAAIGQKTKVEFVDDINAHAKNGQLEINRWGDIEADKKTLQTGIESVFAAGDGVTGPATLIEAIAQAGIAAQSCHQYLLGLEIKPAKKEFLSKKENFREQVPADYEQRYIKQEREEMPVLEASARKNFKEVELGYATEQVAQHEAQRCLECGCTEYFTCDLKRHSTEYEAEQNKFHGEFSEHEVDFSHPYIEIDNNKCILCARCVRICNEIAGANALGLIDRGFDTIVAPAMGNSLVDTTCDTCGLCISTCPTGAITENVPFKPGPVKLDSFATISHFDSTGAGVALNHKNGYVMQVTGIRGLVNQDGNIGRKDKFGYHVYNDSTRIRKPLLRKEGGLKEISFEEAVEIITEKIRSVKPGENVFFAGARLTNEEQYLVQKLARAGAGTNNIGSFHYLDTQNKYYPSTNHNIDLNTISDVKQAFLLGVNLTDENPVIGYMFQNQRQKSGLKMHHLSLSGELAYSHKFDSAGQVQSAWHFIRAMNHYLLANNKHNELFIKDHCQDFEHYRTDLLSSNYEELVKLSGISRKELEAIADQYNSVHESVFVSNEYYLSPSAAKELVNLALITGKKGKTGSGILLLKEKNNSQGLFDTGCLPGLWPSGVENPDTQFRDTLKQLWGIDMIPGNYDGNFYEFLKSGNYHNLFIFGEDPAGCSNDEEFISSMMKKAGFVVVQDYFMTETAQMADLIIPASFPAEVGGSFTNTNKVLQQFEGGFRTRYSPEQDSIWFLNALHEKLGMKRYSDYHEVFAEFVQCIDAENNPDRFSLTVTQQEKNRTKLFRHGCDFVEKKFEADFLSECSKK